MTEESKNFSTTMFQDDTTEITSGKEIRPPLIPSNMESIYVLFVPCSVPKAPTTSRASTTTSSTALTSRRPSLSASRRTQSRVCSSPAP